MKGWPVVSLGELAEFRNGLNYTDADLGRGLAVLGVKDFKDRVTAELDNVDQLAPSALPNTSALLHRDDIVFVRSNGNRELIGRSLYIKDQPQMPTSFSGFTIRCRFHDERCLPRFYAYFFRGPKIRQVLSAQGGGTNISNLNQGILSKLEVPVPAIDIQERVAAILSAYDDLIENNTRRIAILEEMARRIFEEWFVRFRAPGVDPSRLVDSPLGPIPEGWEAKQLIDVCARITDGSHWSPQTVDEGKPMASVKDMREWDFDLSACRQISQEDYDTLVRNDCRPRIGDILIAKDGANLNKHTFLVTEDRELVVLSSIAIIRSGTDIEPEFLTSLLKSSEVSDRIKRSVSGAAIPRIILKDFKKLGVLCPPVELQVRWKNDAGSIHSLCRCLVKANANLRAQRDLLLPKLISGEIDVSVAEQIIQDAAA